MTEGWSLREVSARDVRALKEIARLHVRLLDFGPMAALGERFVGRICYRGPMGDGLLRVVLCEVEGRPVGFLGYTSQSASFHARALRNHWWSAVWLALLAVISDPRRLLRLRRAVNIVFSRRAEGLVDEEPVGELMGMAVLPEYLAPGFIRETGLRVADELVAHARRYCQRAGLRKLRAFVDAGNKRTQLFYHRLGARFRPCTQAGEAVVEVTFDLDPSQDGAGTPMPAIWSVSAEAAASATAPADGWGPYWDGLNDQYKVFKLEAVDCVERLARATPLRPDDRVLDFGCGFGFLANALSPLVGEVYLWDSAAGMRRHARLNVAGCRNVRFLDLSGEDADPGVRFDVILVNSVVQYMTIEELSAWLRRWRRLLAPGGRVLLSDLVPPDPSHLAEALSLLWLCARHGKLAGAIRDGLSEARRYFGTRVARPLLRLSREDVGRLAAAAAFEARFLPESITYRRSRHTAVLSMPAPAATAEGAADHSLESRMSSR